jgi:hypothetical protein
VFGGGIEKLIADSGYDSEANYDFMEASGIESFVKFPMFHKEQKKSIKNNAFSTQNLFYNAGKDFFVCPMDQRMRKVREGTRESGSDSVSHVSYYEAKNCTNCPLQSLCHSAEGNRRIEINHNLNRHKEHVRELLTFREVLMYRRKRPREPEVVFGQAKNNKQYNHLSFG